ncbi:ankyrin repeat domain-containing protein [Brachyspira murdochii]
MAAVYNKFNAAKLLLKNNAEVDMKEEYGMTALMWACHNGN